MIEERSGARRFRHAAWAYVAYTILVILWGAWVRVSFSGDGCGDHWPLCRGTLVPQGGSNELVIELLHRVTSTLCGVFAIGFVVAARRVFPPGHGARRYAWLGLGLVISEGLFGAALVKLRLVAHDTSIARAYLMAAHLCNTFALLFAVVGVAEHGRDDRTSRPRPRGDVVTLVAGYAALLLVGTTGAVTALGDTLFPSQSFRAGLVADFDPGSHPFLQLRAFHPLFALGTSGLLLYVVASRLASAPAPQRNPLRALGALVLVQVVSGFVNIALGAPAAMQIVHLLLADGVFLALTVLSFRTGEAASPD